MLSMIISFSASTEGRFLINAACALKSDLFTFEPSAATGNVFSIEYYNACRLGLFLLMLNLLEKIKRGDGNWWALNFSPTYYFGNFTFYLRFSLKG